MKAVTELSALSGDAAIELRAPGSLFDKRDNITKFITANYEKPYKPIAATIAGEKIDWATATTTAAAVKAVKKKDTAGTKNDFLGYPLTADQKKLLKDTDKSVKDIFNKVDPASQMIAQTVSFFGGNIQKDQAQEMLSIAAGVAKCALGIGAAVSSAGALAGVAVANCVPFLAQTISKYIRKFYIKDLKSRPSPPTFINELQWTTQYLDEVQDVVFDGARDMGSVSNNRKDDPLALVRISLPKFLYHGSCP